MQARWKLGGALAKVERQRVIGPGRGKKGGKTNLRRVGSFNERMDKLDLTWPRVIEAQRIATLPEKELEKEIGKA